METYIKVLLVDDNKDYCDSLADIALNNNLKVISKLNWEEAFPLLKTDTRIEFVILDGKGKITGDQQVEKVNFANHAIDEIKAWSYEQGKHIPFCINTGFMDKFDTLEGKVQMFGKNQRDTKRMFDYIKEEVEKTGYRTLRRKFPDAYKAFDQGIVAVKFEHTLNEIIDCYLKEDYRKKNLNVQRDLLEAILRALNHPIPAIPDSYFYENGQPDLAESIKFLEGRVPQDKSQRIKFLPPADIRSALRKLKESTNSFSHLKEDDVVKYPFLANFYLIMEILCWLPDFVDEHYKNYV